MNPPLGLHLYLLAHFATACTLNPVYIDIDRTLVELERVIGFHQVTDEVEPRIKEG